MTDTAKVHVGDDDPTPDDCDAGWCGAQHPGGYRCTWLAGHLTDDHVAGSSSGRVVAVWPVTA